jgi:aminoacrylate hydrolase
MPYASVAEGALYYEDVGEGEAVVFIPGFGGLASFWAPQIEYFRRMFRVIAVDHRGTGASLKTRGRYSLTQMSEDVLAVLDAAGLSRASLVGHSTGGAIAQVLAATAAERVAKVVLSSTWCHPGNYFRRLFEFRKALLERGDLDGFHKAGIFFRYEPAYAEAHDEVFEYRGGVDVEITISRINAILDADLTPYVAGIQVPALVMAVADDILVPKFLTDDVARLVPGAEYTVLPTGGHFYPETRSAEFNEAVERFLAR